MAPARRKIGLLGGVFDPPHVAHLVLAQTALEELGLDEIWFLPSYLPPHKRSKGDPSATLRAGACLALTPFAHRCRMTKLAVRGNRRFKVLDIEKKKGGISYTVETLALLKKKHPRCRFYLILGADNLKILSTSWREPKKVFSMATPVFARRPNGKVGARRAVPPLKRAVWLNNPLLDISSSDLRARVKAGRSIRHLVPEGVERYIRAKRLYR